MRVWRSIATVVLVAWLSIPPAARADEGLEFFEAKIRPVLVKECYECHAADSKQVHGGLLLDHQAGLLKGGDSGPAVTPGNVAASSLIAALRHETFEMPPKGKLPEDVIQDFVRWIELGAPDPRGEATETKSQAMSLEEAANHWAYRPLVRPPLPPLADPSWPLNEIDHFVLAKLEANGLRPVRPATKREWIRRATFDLIGLPPTPREVEAFLADESSSAFETVIERLLGSPHYGERWGRHWLDVARYAEDQAHTFAVKPSTSGYRYRDWVIDAFNNDLPYDQFVKLQIAADLMDLNEAERFRHLPALGFFGLGAQYYKNSDAERAKADELDDRVDTLTRGFLGLTVSCARCHDHKYDAIPTQDYYSLAGVFQSSKLDDAALVPQPQVEAYQASQQRIAKADESVKAFVAERKRTVAEAEAIRLADYAVAAWRFRQAEAAGKPLPLAELASPAGLAEPILRRWVDWLADESRRKPAPPETLMAWVRLAQAVPTTPPTTAPAASAETSGNPTASGTAAVPASGSVASDSSPASTVEAELTELAERIETELRVALDIRAGRLPAGADLTADATSPPKFEPGKPRYTSPLVTKLNPIVDLSVDLTGATELHLVIADAGDGKSCDHADWIEPMLLHPDGPIRLTDLKWKQAETGFGNVNVDRNVSGQPLRVGGQKFDNGLGSHAPCILVYDLPPGVTRFQARAGLDNGGSDQGACGDQASIQFRVYTESPNDRQQLLAGEVKPDQGVLSQTQTELLRWALAEKGIFEVSDQQLDQLLSGPPRDELAKLRDELKSAQQAAVPQYPVAHVISEAQVADMHVFIRGNPARRGELAPRRFLRLLADVAPADFSQGSGRLELAQAIADPRNPLTPRVFVNRVWQQHFGRGLVGTPSNFGALGEAPTHPELLDHLATKFVASGWSIKSLHREIMLSATYRLSSDWDEQAAAVDGDNRWLWRMNRRRLDVEAWRDALLAVSGRLDGNLTGPSTELDATDNVRRTVYGKVSRHELNGLLRLFDFPDANITSERRSETTVPQQQLFVLNSPFMIDQAKAVAQRLFADAARPLEDQIREAFLVLYGRPASDAEIRLGTAFLNQSSTATNDQLSRAQRYAQVLLGANEFTFID
jgi:hypothetical protein